MTQPIDFTKPIEHVDGTPCKMSNALPMDDEWVGVVREDGEDFTSDQSGCDSPQPRFLVNREGRRFSMPSRPPYIRNRQPQPSRIPDDVVERMVAFFRSVERDTYVDSAYMTEARSIAKALPEEPIDLDVIAARELCAEYAPALKGHYMAGDFDTHRTMEKVLKAIKRGRELAANEKGEG